MLDRYYVLDLTSGRNRLAGMILAQLGANVVRPCDSESGEADDQIAYFENRGKQLWMHPTTLGDAPRRADVVILDRTSPSRWDLQSDEIGSSRTIVCNITPYGMDGPWSQRHASELTIQAASGHMWLNGDPDRPPVPVGGNQANYQAASQAAVAIVSVLYARERHQGPGEVIDVSAQEAMCNAIVASKAWYDLVGRNLMRTSMNTMGGQVQTKVVWTVLDGYVCWRIGLGVNSSRQMHEIVEWMRQKGLGEELTGIEWESISTLEVTPEQLREWESIFAPFFKDQTREELFRGARERDVVLLPVMSLRELVDDAHLTSRKAVEQVTQNGRQFAIPVFPVRVDSRPPLQSAPQQTESPEFPPLSEPASPQQATKPPLDGVKIVDFGWAVAGPVATRCLAMLGATVVKVESNTKLDFTRASTPFSDKPSRNRSGYFSAHNGNKLSITIDINRPESPALIRRLVEWADVVCENFSAGRLEDWGLSPATLQSWNPALIVARSSTWGQDGPYASAGSTGVVLSGFSGLAELTRWRDRKPLLPVEPYTDMISPWYTAVAIAAALVRRLHTGEGAVIDISQLECVLNSIAPEMAQLKTGSAHRVGSGPFKCDPYPGGVFKCSGDEDWCAVSILTQEEWASVCGHARGLEGLDAIPAQELPDHSPLVFSLLSWYFSERTAEAAAAELQQLGIAAARVAKPEDLFQDPQLGHRGHFVKLEHPRMGSVRYDMPSFRLGERPLDIRRSPLIGEHTEYVLTELLGMAEDEIADYFATEVLN